MKKFIIVLVLIALITVGVLSLMFLARQDSQSMGTTYKDATYLIDGQEMRLEGYSSTGTNSSSTGVVQYYGLETQGDLDLDGVNDVAFVLTHNPGGSGTFYYLAGALKKPEGYVGTEAIFLGDRIVPTRITVVNGQITAEWLTRRDDEPMSAQATVPVRGEYKIGNTTKTPTN